MKKLICACAFGLALAASATTYYVSPTGDGSNPTAGFATGYAKIEDGIAAATTDGDVVLLDRGTFKATGSMTIEIKKAITVTGVGAKEETIIDGQNKYDYWLFLQNQGAKVQNLTLAHNGTEYTGCLGMKMSSGMISNVVARQNGNKFNGNARDLFYMTGGLLTHCVITNNYAPNCPGVYLNNGTVENCYIADNKNNGKNSGWYGSAIRVENSGTVRNCTIVGNKGNSAAIYSTSDNAKLYNNIIWGNTHLTGADLNNWNLNGKSAKNWIGNQTTDADTLNAAGNSNSSADPLLTPDNFNIMKASPCNGTAVKEYAAAIDFNNTVRGDKPSRGCVEYVDLGTLSCVISATATSVNYPETVTVEAQIDGTVTEPLSYVWDLKSNGKFLSTDAKPVLSAIGCYHPSVTITDANGKTVSATFANDIVIYGNEGISYVTNGENPNAEAPYATWETAATNIADAVQIAQIGSTVLLSAGDHVLNGEVEINKRMTLTTVAGDTGTSIRCKSVNGRLFVLNAAGAIVENFCVTNQSFNNYKVGAAISIMNGGVRNCRFIRNLPNGHGMVTTDGDSTDAFVENCVFEGNYMPGASQGPSGVKLMGKRARCVNCLFVGNTNLAYAVGYPGGALYAASGSAIVRNCTFVDNRSRLGSAGVVATGTSFDGTIENCIFTGNTTTNWTENTLVKSDDPVRQTYENKSGDPGAITDYLLSSNSLRYCCIEASTNDYTNYTKILKDDPLFVDPANGDYTLLRTDDPERRVSPCVNAGVNGSWTKDDKDLAGNPRINRSIVDLGAYENQTNFPNMILIK